MFCTDLIFSVFFIFPVGMFKTIILYISVGYCGILAIHFHGGINAFLNSVYLPSDRFFNLLARGSARDIGAGISLILGVITTQAYISAVISAKTEKTAKIAAYISGILIPVIGIAGIFVGLYMKLNYPDIQASMALPLFIIKKIHFHTAGKTVYNTSQSALIFTENLHHIPVGISIVNNHRQI